MNKSYEDITNKLVKKIQESGILPWHQPYFGHSNAVSYVTGKPYSWLNQWLIICQAEGQADGQANEYLTWHQIQQHQAHLRKGCHGYRVYFWNTFEKVEIDNEGNRITKQIPYLKSYTVFSVNDCEGIQPRWQRNRTGITTISPIKHAEELVTQYLTREKINLEHIRNEAYYSVSRDTINLPSLSNHRSAEDYYATLLHECVHSSGHEKRLHRFKSNDHSSPFGSPNYSREELVAEMGAAFLLNHLNIDNPSTFQQNAAYIQSWIRALQNDVSLIAIAAGKAEKAVQFILGQAA
jgi:antirestriction protein ArdC